jgi:hypothetical protein
VIEETEMAEMPQAVSQPLIAELVAEDGRTLHPADQRDPDERREDRDPDQGERDALGGRQGRLTRAVETEALVEPRGLCH